VLELDYFGGFGVIPLCHHLNDSGSTTVIATVTRVIHCSLIMYHSKSKYLTVIIVNNYIPKKYKKIVKLFHINFVPWRWIRWVTSH